MSGKERLSLSTVIKRRKAVQEDESPSPSHDSRDVFRQLFEQHYAPLEQLPSRKLEVEEPSTKSDDESSGSDWDGFSDTEDQQPAVQVVDYTAAAVGKDESSLGVVDSYKSYMSSKPPSIGTRLSSNGRPAKRQKTTEEDNAEADDLKNDLALQRLLKESHLLESNKTTVPTGTQRHQAIDLRLRSLGSKESLFNQTKMPLSHRKGIKAKASAKESRRRQEAKENGIILERPVQSSKSKPTRRDRGVGNPGVGKFTGGTLKLSRKDIQSIQGPRSKTRHSKKGR